jgi:hypothetical protein
MARPVRRVPVRLLERMFTAICALGLLPISVATAAFGIRHGDYLAFLFSLLFLTLTGIGLQLARRPRR